MNPDFAAPLPEFRPGRCRMPWRQRLALLALAISTVAGCGLTEPDDRPFRLHGTVRAVGSNAPVHGARVSLLASGSVSAPGEVLGSAITDSLGEYELTARQPRGYVRFGNCGILEILAEANGFASISIGWPLPSPVRCTPDLQRHDLLLQPLVQADGS